MPTDPPSLADVVTSLRVTHHVTTRVLLDHMTRALDRVAAATPVRELDRVLALKRVFAYFRDDLRAHLSTEERTVFPYMLALERAVREGAPAPRAAFRSIASPIQVMKNEQECAESSLDRLATAIACARPTSGAPAAWRELDELVADLRADLTVHAGIEQNVLFPAAVDLEHQLVARRLATVGRRAG
jgi:regulator of cell morphogenesis and NO signaling